MSLPCGGARFPGYRRHGDERAGKLAKQSIAWAFALEPLPIVIVDQTDPPADRRQPAVGVVVPQQQAVLGPASEHAVRLIDAPGDEVVDEHADIRLGAVQDQGVFAFHPERRVDAGHQPLRRCLLVAGRAVDLPREITARRPASSPASA